jgi:hypothetical protein
MSGRCESCGVDGVELVAVQRIYLVTPTDGVVGADQVTVLDDIEQWCYVCRSMYPHAAVAEEH